MNLSYNDIQTPKEVWTEILNRCPIHDDEVFYEPFAGEKSLYNQVLTNKKYYTEINEDLDVFNFDYKLNNDITTIYTNPPYKCNIPDKKGNIKPRNAVYYFLAYFMTHFVSLKKIGFIMNMKCFNSITPKRLKKLNDFGFTISSITMFNCDFWYGLQLFVLFDKQPNICFKYIENVFRK